MKHYIFTLLLLALSSSAFSQVRDTDPIAPIAAQNAVVLSIKQGVTTTNNKYGLFDRVEMQRSIPKGQTTAIAFPCEVDGYFFGADAKRYVVKKMRQTTNAYGVKEYRYLNIDLEEMADDEDFQPNKYYIVCPTVATSTVLACVSGLKVNVDTAQKQFLCGVASKQLPFYDVNEDDVVDEADVEGITRFILHKDTTGLNRDTADINEDGTIDNKDIVCLINIILSGVWKEKLL